MATSNASTVLQAVANIRNWVVSHIPLTGSLVGYDLFLLIGHAHACGTTLALADARRQLSYPAETVDEHLGELEMAGLVNVEGSDGDRRLVPTARFAALLDEYQRLFERTFIPRDRLRSTQLLCGQLSPQDRELAELMYDRFFDLGWFYLHNYGSTCFMMATMVERVAQMLGRRARMAFGSVELSGGNRPVFRMGEGQAKPGQVDGHAYCIIDDRVLIDFGLGNLRRAYRRDFAWGAAVQYLGQDSPASVVQLGDGTTMVWTETPLPVSCAAELQACTQHAELLTPQYLSMFPLEHGGTPS